MKTLKLCLLALGFVGAACLLSRAADPPPTSNPPSRSKPPLVVSTNSPSNSDSARNPTTPLATATNAVAAASASGANPAERAIRFQFDGMPYMDVINRFAQMDNKPLLSDSRVEGTLTFNDPRPYTYSEAFEMLNLILSMKGVMLVETDRYLRLVQLKDLPQMPLRIFRGLDQTGDARPGEVVTVVLTLKNLDATDLTQAVSTMLSNAGSVAPLSRGRGMIITDRLANIKRIQNLMDQIDTMSPVQRQMRTYTLLNASGALIADLINKTFGEKTAPKRIEFNQQTKQLQSLPPDPSDYVTAIFDDASRTLVLYGPVERLTLAESLIKRFEDQSGAKASEIRIYTPQTTSATDLARMIRQAIPGVAGENEPPAVMATKARLVVDLFANRLIVTAPLAGQLDAIEELVKKVDGSGGAAGAAGAPRSPIAQVTKVVRCRTADPEIIVRVLTDTFARPLPPLDSSDPSSGRVRFGFRNRLNPSLRVTFDAKTQNIILVGPSADVQQALEIISQLDSDQPEKRSLRVFALKTNRATDFSSKVRQLYQDQIRSQPGAGSTDALIIPDDAGKRLIVTATEEHLKLIEDLITQLDGGADSTTRQLKSITLKNASASALAAILSQWFSRPSRMEDPNLRVFITASPDDQTVIVEATPTTLARIEEVIHAFDVAPGNALFEVRTYHLTDTSAADLAQTLTRFFVDRPDRRVRNPDAIQPAPQPRFDVDYTSNTLIVAATKEQFVQIEQLTKDLKASALVSRVIKIVPCQTADPNTLIRVITDALTRPSYGGRAAQTLRITPDPRTRSLILIGTPEDVQRAIEIMAQLDTTQPEQRSLKMFTVQSDNSAEFAAKVQQLYQDQVKTKLGAGAADALIMGDAYGNRLIVTATESHMKLIEGLVSKLDAEPAGSSRQLKTIKLVHASANVIASMITQLFNRPTPTRSNDPNLRVVVTATPDDQAVMVEAASLVMAKIEAVVRDLDVEPAQTALEVRTYHLVEASAGDMAQTLSRFFAERQDRRPRTTDYAAPPQPRFEADYISNTLMVAATKDQFPQIEKMLQELRTSAQIAQVMRIVPCKAADPSTLIRIISDALTRPSYGGRTPPPLKITPDPKTRNLILLGTSEDVQRAIEIMNQLEANQGEARTLRIFTVKSDRSAEFAAKIQQLYQDQIRNQPGGAAADALVMGDAYGNRLIVTATESHMKLIEGLVTQLDAEPAGSTRQLKTVVLKHTSANAVASMITQLFNRQTRNDDPNLRVVITASPDDQSVIVEAASLVMAKIQDVIRDLDLEPEHGAYETRTYRLAGANVDELAQRLTRLFAERQDRRRQDTAQAPPPRFEADPSSSSLIVAGTKDQFVAIEELIKQLQATFEVASEVRTFKLQYSTAESMVQLLETMLGEDSATRQNRPWYYYLRNPPTAETAKLRVAAAPNLNAVVVQGPPQKLSAAEQLIRTLDKPETDLSSTLQAVHLTKGTAEAVADAVNKTLTSRVGAGRAKRVTVTPVGNSNSILIDGPSTEVNEVLQIIRDLDKESSGGNIEFHIYKLENGKAKELSRVLTDMLRGIPRRRSRAETAYPEAPVTVSVDERSNSLIVSAPPDMFKFIDQLLPTLDKAPERTNRDLNYFWLTNADAYDVASKIDALYEDRPRADRPTVDADVANNAVTVVANKADLLEIEQMIQRLDETAVNTSLQVRLVALDKIPVEQMAAMVRSIYSQMSTNEIKIVDKLPPRPREKPAFKTSLSPPSLTNQPPKTAEAPATGAPRPKPEPPPAPPVFVAVDKNANALILSGPARELDQIQTIIRDLSYSAANDAELRLFPLKEADPVVVARTLNQLFQQGPVQVVAGQGQGQRGRGGMRQGTTQAPNPPQGQPPPQPPPPRMFVVAEPRTRSLIVRAKPTDFILLESLIKQLDVAGVSSQLAYRLVPAVNVRADKLLLLVNQMINQLNLVRPGEPVAVIQDPRGDALFMVARVSLLDQIESMIHELDTPSTVAESEVLMIPLKNAQAPQLSAILQDMIHPSPAGPGGPAGGGGGRAVSPSVQLQDQVRRLKIHNERGEQVLLDLTKPIKISADPLLGAAVGSNRLILISTPDNLKALEAVVAIMDTVPIMEGISARLVHLKNADATTAAQTLNSIFQQGQRLMSGGGGGPGGGGRGAGRGPMSQLNVAIDLRSNTLIISGREESLALAQNLIDQLDRDFESMVTEVKLFTLKHASAAALAPLLQTVFTENRGAMAGTPGLRTQITRLQTALGKGQPKVSQQPATRAAVLIQNVDPANILIVAARSDMMPLIEDVITTLDIPEASGVANIRIYPLQHADAATLQRLLTDLYRGPSSSQVRREDRPNISIDDRTNALIVSGNETAFAIINSLVERLDKPLPDEFRNIQILRLQNADAQTLAGSLQRLVDARLGQQPGSGRQQTQALRIVIIADPRTNSLLVGGAKDGFELVRSLAQELDNTDAALSGQVRLVPLKHATAQTLASALGTLFLQKAQATQVQGAPRIRPVIVPDPRGNNLMIAATVEDNRAIDALLEKLDRVPENPAVTLTVIGLRHNDSQKVATMLSTVFTARHQSLTAPGQPPVPQDQVHVEADPLTNALIISANQENLELIKGLLAKVDVEPVAVEGLIQVFTLKQADAQRAANMLTSLITQGLYRPGMALPGGGKSQRDAIAVAVDRPSNSLIVSASPENILVVKELVKQIDSQANADGGDIRLFTLKHARASQLSTVLQQFFTAKRASESIGGGPGGAGQRSVPVTVTPDDRTNTLLVTGGKETFAAVQRMIDQLDAQDILAKTTFQVFALKQATAAKLQGTLAQLFAKRPAIIKGVPPEPITVIADSWANALVIGAAPEDMPMVESLVQQLDSDRGASGTEVQVLQLAKADARRIAQTLTALYNSGGPGTASPVTVNVDERVNAIVVSAGQADLKRIAELVKKLDTDQVANVSEIRIFGLKNARALQLATLLTSLLNTKPVPLTDQSPSRQSLLQFITRSEGGKELLATALKEGILVQADPRTNSLIVSAPLDYMNLLEQLISHLDSSSAQMAKIRVFNLKNADARQMSTILMSVFRLQRTAGQAANDRTIQYTLVRSAPANSGLEDEDEESPGATATLGGDEDSALTVNVDLRTNSLIIGGTEHYVALAGQMIESLDSSPGQERQAEVYQLKNSRATEIQTALASFTKQDQQLLMAAVGQQAMAQELLDREIAIVAETNSNTLLISGSPRYLIQIKEIIDKLDQPQLQVLIQVLLAEVTLDATDDLGVEWTYQSKGNPSTKTGTDFGIPNLLKNAGGFSSAVSGNNFNFLIRALQSEGRLQVLSRPQIVAANNQQAKINVTQSVPLIASSQIIGLNGNVNNQFQYKDVGVILLVTPRISPDGFVKLDIQPTISQLSSSTVTVSPGFQAPLLNERSAQTTVSVQSGQSILIGGLISTTDNLITKRLPILGKIPWLGALFRSTSKTQNRTELLVLLTPQVLIQPKETGKMGDAQAITREQLNKSTISDTFDKNDILQKRLLEGIYPDKKKEPATAPKK